MTRLKRFSFLVATLVLVAQCVTATNIAVVLTDVKFDDKMAIHVLSHSGDFDEIVAVLSCVEDQDAAHADLLDFLSKMNKNKKLYGPGMLESPPRLTVFKGDNLMEVTAPHEATFLGTKVDSNLDYFNADSFNKHLELLYSSSAGQPLQKITVEIFQIAPAHRTQVETLAAMDNIDITLFHLVHGYNSAQTKANGYGGTESFDFVTQIGPIIHTKHPKAKIVFTQSAQTFLHREGGIQPYAKLIDGPVPADHLEAALNDPFYAREFTLAVRVLDEAKLIIVINQLKRVAKLMMKFEYYQPLGRRLGTEEFPLVDLPKNVFRAGMQVAYKDGIDQEKLAKRQEEDAAIRNHYIKFIEDGISFLDEQEENERTLRNNLNTFVRDFLTGADPLISPYVKYMSGELTAKKLDNDQNWIAQMKDVAVVDEETEFDEYEDMRYYQYKAIVEDLDKDNYESDKNDWYDYNYKEIFTLLLRARKNLEGDISQKLRKNILDFTEAIGPIIFDFQPKIHNGLATRFEYVIPKAFLPDTALTVEVCDANHILVVRHAIKAAKILGVDKFQDIGLASDKNGQIIFKFEKVMMGESYVWHGKTLTGLRAADSFKLLEPYLLRKKNVRALRLVEAVPLTEEE